MMKLVAGMGSIEDYVPFVKSGADELFIGYVPMDYRKRFGVDTPLNRREVRYYNVQIGSESELLILRDMIEKYRVPVTIAFNSLNYTREQREYITELVRHLNEIGFSSFILADPELIRRIGRIEGDGKQKNIPELSIHVSGEYGELNRLVLQEFDYTNVKRIIFPRQTEITEMQALAKAVPKLSYEAFFLNEKCHFTGAYCNSLHCDEMCHICKLPYRLGSLNAGTGKNARIAEEKSYGQMTEEKSRIQNASEDRKLLEIANIDEDGSFGSTGCGVCAAWRLREAGVTHLKIVSRGNAADATMGDIRQAKELLEQMEICGTAEEFEQKVLRKYRQKCSGNCYYYGEL